MTLTGISYLFTFRIFSFLRQKLPKIDAKTQSQKIIKKWRSGHPFWDPKSMKIDAGSPEKRLNCEKTSFLEDTVFWSFFRCVFSWILRPLGIPGGLPKSTFPPLFSTFWRACRFRAAPGVSWDRFGSIFHRFSVDFGTIFGRFLLAFLSLCCRSVAHLGPILDRLFLVEHRPCGKKLWLGRPKKEFNILIYKYIDILIYWYINILTY